MSIAELASKINEFFDYFYPYAYMDAFSTPEEGYEAYLRQLTESPESTFSDLMDVYDEFGEETALNLANMVKEIMQ